MEKGDVKECPDCASHNIVYSEVREQIICHDCGLIFEPFQAVETPKSSPLKMPVTVKQKKEVSSMAKKKKSHKKKSHKRKSSKKSKKKSKKRR